ncbi:hypothetical protein Pst134EA_029110 [Puccinia striiformis f. sp. tritici]|uniref:uncharacterized protein n=1 Tax=Puccinia striiformis f. sp. tritici TaxID=168172 RepID=UPI0020078704|nr:uncharacterized protein Pst134EA_032965 [Puccinia striiformis f. sp. tritici]XP_047798202.1 hypothetical protein Pst134EA_029110 [Puccinia striiformis f. sp. tritici]KAH9441156.1 hypothetical protein Pst134EB_029819 [Puccinia striiformis f. sp. tritici]KAH9443476.1 hypothetical protein Pst134EA_032965 [Puccinia striiformis f. sp. tritici]KAH9447112.1 hypothetical protein Pst134EA_029110 [Puccinia striiformis f. sp. tritici]
MRALKKFLHPPALSPVGDSEKVTKEQKSRKKKLEEWTILLLHYEVARESKRNNAVARYDKYGFGKTSNYLATSINVPNVCRGVTYLSCIRMGALPTVGERVRSLNALKRPHGLNAGICPCCNEEFEVGQEEWSHLILTCIALQEIRNQTIGGLILMLMESIDTDDARTDEHLYILLLGGVIRDFYPGSLNRPEESNTPFMETSYGTGRLTQFLNGYGHIPHVYPRGRSEHGYVPIAGFLQQAVPLLEKALYETGEERAADEESSSSNRTPTGAVVSNPSFREASGGNSRPLNVARPNGMPEPSTSDGVG